MYDLSLQQFRRGSLATARLGFREFLRVYPTHEHAPDALFYLGETWGGESADRSEEHTSELQSPCNLVCRLLLEKKNKIKSKTRNCCCRHAEKKTIPSRARRVRHRVRCVAHFSRSQRVDRGF